MKESASNPADDEQDLDDGAHDASVDLDPGAHDADGGGDPDAEDGDGSTDDVAGLRDEIAELNDRHLRLAAEFNNYRRRNEQERLESWSRAQADLVARFVEVLDDLQRVSALDLSNATVEGIIEGVDLVERKFARALTAAGVEVIDPPGDAFDPERMEAIMRVPAESGDQDDQVAQVFQKGYALKGQLVRPARVSVYKAD